MRIEYADVCGSETLWQCQSRLHERGYREANGQLEAGQYSYYVSDAAPGWQDSMYCLSVAMRDGEALAEILRGL